MAAPQIQYETLYGIGLLDDLHNYFPAILYDSGRFHTVPQLLHYIRIQSRNRFDLFTFGERSYLDAQARANQRNTASVSMTFENWVPAQRVNPVAVAVAANPTQSVPPEPHHDVRPESQEENDGDDEDDGDNETEGVNITSRNQSDSSNLDRLLMVALMDVLANGSGSGATRTSVRTFQRSDIGSIASLLTSRDNILNLGNINLDTILQPVIVRPTLEQISNGSEIIQLTNSEVCSICQDVMNTTDTVRRLRACNHNFHQGCIDTWYGRNVHCPICRHDIREQNMSAVD